MGISDGISAVPRNRKLSEFRSVEQKYKQLSEFRYEPFRGRENNSEQSTEAENVSYIYLFVSVIEASKYIAI